MSEGCGNSWTRRLLYIRVTLSRGSAWDPTNQGRAPLPFQPLHSLSLPSIVFHPPYPPMVPPTLHSISFSSPHISPGPTPTDLLTPVMSQSVSPPAPGKRQKLSVLSRGSGV